jgi:hypothetical protein
MLHSNNHLEVAGHQLLQPIMASKYMMRMRCCCSCKVGCQTSVSQPANLLVSPSAIQPVCLSARPSVRPLIHLSVRPSARPSVAPYSLTRLATSPGAAR